MPYYDDPTRSGRGELRRRPGDNPQPTPVYDPSPQELEDNLRRLVERSGRAKLVRQGNQLNAVQNRPSILGIPDEYWAIGAGGAGALGGLFAGGAGSVGGGAGTVSSAVPTGVSGASGPGLSSLFPSLSGPTAAAGTSAMPSFLDYFKDPKNLIGIGKGAFENISDRQESGAQRDFLRQQNEANRQMSREQTALNASQSAGLDPAMQRQKAALLMALLQGARNFNVTPSDPRIAATMPKLSGGLQLPAGGFSPETLNFLSPESLRNQEQNYQQQIRSFLPEMPQVDLSRVGYPQSLQPPPGGPRAVPTAPNALQQALQMGSRRNPLRGGNV